MAEDRFGDLGGPDRGTPPKLSAAERLAAGDEAELAAERRQEQSQAPKPSSAYSWLVGIVFLIVIAVAGLNTLGSEGEGLRGPTKGDVIPAFAAPLALGSVDADVNLKANGDQPGGTLACDVHVASALNGCDLRKGPSVIVFAGTRGADCLPGFDRIERVRRDFREVQFAGILIRMGRAEAAKTVRKGRWSFPIAFDRDGQLTNVYGIGVCPATIFARKGGRVVATKLGRIGEREMRATIRRIL